MVHYCVAYNCNSTHTLENKHLSFHRFPFARPEILKEWVRKIRRKDFKPTKHSRLCSEHFDNDSYQLRPGAATRRLKEHAIPKIFNYSPYLIQPATKERRVLTGDIPDQSTQKELEEESTPQVNIDSEDLDDIIISQEIPETNQDIPKQKKNRKQTGTKKPKQNNQEMLMNKATEALDFAKSNMLTEDRYDSFGKYIASELRTIRNEELYLETKAAIEGIVTDAKRRMLNFNNNNIFIELIGCF